MDLYLTGQFLGFVALTSLVIQLVLAGRLRFLDKRFGLGRVMAWHKYNAYVMLAALLVHPVLVFYRSLFAAITLSNLGNFASALKFFSLPIWLGETAFAMIIFTVALTLLSKKFNWDYRKWRFLHKIGYLAVVLGFAHSFLIGSHIVTRGAGFYYWVFLMVVAVTAIGYRYGYRWFKLRENIYQVVKIVKETHDVRSIWLEPVKGKAFNYRAGQFSFVTFYSNNLPHEEHHFTISSPPNHNPIRFTVKESGDFTSQLDKLKVGDRARLDGPYGNFTLEQIKNPNVPLLFIAGGIGITPIMSMLEELYTSCHGESLTLIYANKTAQDIVFKERLNELEARGFLNVVHVLSQEKRKTYYHGYVTEEIIKKEVPNVTTREVLLVGPPPMMKAVREALLNLNVPQGQIHSEKFSLR